MAEWIIGMSFFKLVSPVIVQCQFDIRHSAADYMVSPYLAFR